MQEDCYFREKYWIDKKMYIKRIVCYNKGINLIYGGDFLDQGLWNGNEKNVEHFNLGGFKNLFR